MTDEKLRVDEVRRRLVRANLAPMVARLQLLTLLMPPQESDLVDALILAALHPSDVEIVERVRRCWLQWRLVMSSHESFGAYARRNMAWRR